jgi:hypothetical protein
MAITYLPSWNQVNNWMTTLPKRIPTTRPRTRSHVARPAFPDLPSRFFLPPEIWLEVFRHATWVPGALDIDDHDAIVAYSSDEHAVCLQSAYDASMETKQAIRLVCSGWLAIAAPLTLQYCMIRSGRQAAQLAHLLDTFAATYPGARSYGWYTTRLEVLLEGAHDWDVLHSNAVIRILEHCPNLRIFSSAHCAVEGDIFNGSKLAARLAERPLRRLEMRADHSLLTPALRERLLVLHITTSKRVSPSLQALPPVLPALELAILSHRDTTLLETARAWELPSLRGLAIHKPPFAVFPDLDSIGLTIRHLVLPSASSVLPALRACPALESLEIHLNCSVLVPLDRVRPQPALRQLTIRGCSDLARPADWYAAPQNALQHTHLRAGLATLVARQTFPALERVRFVLPAPTREGIGADDATEAPSALVEVWGPWFEQCHHFEIQVLAARGAQEATADIWRPLIGPQDL